MPIQTRAFNQSEIKNSDIAVILRQAGIPAGEITVTKLTDGRSLAMVYKIQNAGDTYALKIFPGQHGVDTANTFWRFAAQNAIPTPKILYSSGPSEICRGYFILTEWLDHGLLNKIGKWSGQYGYGKEAGILLKRVHEIKTGGFGFLNSKNQWTCKSAAGICDLWIKRINGKMDPDFSGIWQTVLEKTLMDRRLRDFSDPVLLHGDFCVNNIFCRRKIFGKKITALIDAAEPVSGDPMSDLGHTQTTNSPKLIIKGIWDGYTKRQKLTEAEHDRFLRWRLVHQFFAICKAADRKKNKVPRLLEDLNFFLKEVD